MRQGCKGLDFTVINAAALDRVALRLYYPPFAFLSEAIVCQPKNLIVYRFSNRPDGRVSFVFSLAENVSCRLLSMLTTSQSRLRQPCTANLH
ncbi:hypothetical protein HMPREF9120_01178 [Neisseria sp. oral taxon 020 str. F0370]|nr:hypothetical protein HMPREF9120_01178 [Neisseria sp. oral taxon 020 str. F0370]